MVVALAAQSAPQHMVTLSSIEDDAPGEIGAEKEAIRARYADPQPRLFPVAVMLLVPVRLGHMSFA
jgi:hypothetical protein